MSLEIIFEDHPRRADVRLLEKEINKSLPAEIPKTRPFAFFLRNSQQELLGGATGFFLFGSVYTDMLWVHPTLQGQGYGKKFMQQVEKLGIQNQCTFATVNTMSFQAVSFYLKIGYNVEFKREGYLENSINYFLRKQIVS